METTPANLTLVKALTYLMFMMFAMTTDSVGIIIPEIIKTFGLSMTAAGTLRYATMAGIALAGVFLGSLADRLGRKPTIVIGLTSFGIASLLFAAGDSFAYFSVLLAIWGIAIGVFKTGALALIGDIRNRFHNRTCHPRAFDYHRCFMEMALRAGWRHLRPTHFDRVEGTLPGKVTHRRKCTRPNTYPAHTQEPVRTRVLLGRILVCRGRGGDLRMDAHSTPELSRACGVAGGV